MSTKPHDVGPHWFLPHLDCENSERHKFPSNRPHIVFVGKPSWAPIDEGFSIEIGECRLLTDALRGDWEPIILPKRMARKMASRKQQARDKANRS